MPEAVMVCATCGESVSYDDGSFWSHRHGHILCFMRG